MSYQSRQHAKLNLNLWTLLLLLVAFVVAIEVSALVEKECRVDLFRLPRRVQPRHYELNIRPNLDKLTFEGRVNIDLYAPEEAVEHTNVFCHFISSEFKRVAGRLVRHHSEPPIACDSSKIVLHADEDLELVNVKFASSSSGVAPIFVKSVCRDYENSLLVVELNTHLISDSRQLGQLSLQFNGMIRDDLHGFYRSAYQEPATGATKYMAITQFEAPHARKAFPCFDEPDFKATFDLTIEHESHLVAIANMPVKQEQLIRQLEPSNEAGDMKRVQFERTPRMSTYLLAYAVGQFEHVTSSITHMHDGPIKFSIYTSPGNIHLAEYAIDKMAHVYAELREYFQVEQPLKKIDFLAVNDLDAEAMENWGLVTFQARSLLFSLNADDEAPPDRLITALQTITHELAHQWFGNLVTMKWWDDLWLNEGFATWLTLVINDKLYPQLDNDLLHLLESQILSMNDDAEWEKTHPIKNKGLASVQEIEDTFDAITYDKSSSVIRMLNEYLGHDKFELGIKKYLAEYAYANTDSSQLWRSLEQTTGLKVADMMRSWIEQAGFPLVSVSLVPELGGGSSLRFTQTRYSSRGVTKPKRSGLWLTGKHQLWSIPISVQISNGRKTVESKFVLTKASDTIKLPYWFDVKNPKVWLKVNKNFAGFFMTHYESESLFESLDRPIRSKLIGAADRLNVLSDTHALFKSGRVSLEQLDETLDRYENEDNDVVIDLLSRIIHFLELYYSNELSNSSLQEQQSRVNLLLKYIKRTGNFEHIPSDGLVRKRTRASVLRRLVAMNHRGTINSLLEVFNECLAGKRQMAHFLQKPIKDAVEVAGTDLQRARVAEFVNK